MKKMLLRLFVLIFFMNTAAFSQSTKMDKKLEKAKELVEKNKLDNAEEVMVKMLKEEPGFGEGWDYLAYIRFQQYRQAKKKGDLGFSISTTDKDGKKVESDSLTQQLASLMDQIQPSKLAYKKYVYTMKKGSLLSDDASGCAITLRTLYVDQDVDTNVSKKALKYYEKAEEEFEKKNYNEAAKNYKRAIEEQPDFYKARLYLGDSYYFTGNYIDAIRSFEEAAKTFPNLIEPRKFLVDAYMKNKMYEEAYREAVLAMGVYPDLVLVFRLDDIVYELEKKIDLKWIPRQVFPNKMKDTSNVVLDLYQDPDSLVATGAWKAYKNAYQKIESSCNKKGLIVKSTNLTKSNYLEVYSWEEMLKDTSIAWLEDARHKQADGFLDCYALITCYHIDIYEQYLDFVSKNRAKVEEYYKRYTVKK